MVEANEPIIGDQIAELLGVSRPTIRSDLSVLVMLGYLNAKPKVGYFTGEASGLLNDWTRSQLTTPVRMVQSPPVLVHDVTSVYDAVVTLFLEDVGSLIVIDKDNHLSGIVSRKDLLKMVISGTQAASMPVSMIMTRHPNVVTVGPDDSVIVAARKMIQNEIDTLPVVEPDDEESSSHQLRVTGRVTKTTMTKVLLELAASL